MEATVSPSRSGVMCYMCPIINNQLCLVLLRMEGVVLGLWVSHIGWYPAPVGVLHSSTH